MLNFRSECGVQASETQHLPTRYHGEYWVEARDKAGMGTGARVEVAGNAEKWNKSHRAKKKKQKKKTPDINIS